MEAKAVVRYARMSPQKARLVADLVRGKKVGDALNILRFTNKATAKIVGKLIASAKANAENKNMGDADNMLVETIFVDQGPVMKRRLARSRGRVDVIRKPFSHVTVILKGVEKPKKSKAVPKKVKAADQGKAEGAKQEEKPAVKKAKPAAKKTKTTKEKES